MNKEESKDVLEPYFFEEVMLTLVIKDYRSIIQAEILRKPKHFRVKDKNIKTNSSFFESFPRDSLKYCEIITTLTEIAKYDLPNVLEYLSKISINLSQKKNTQKILTEFGNIQFPFEIHQLDERVTTFLFLIFLADLICSIISKYGVTDNPAKLIECGLFLYKHQMHLLNFSKLILEQWSVIFSYISLQNADFFFKKIFNFNERPKFEIESFFILIRFVRLDAPNCPYESIIDYIKKLIKLKSFTSPILISLSTILMTYPGDPNNLRFFYDMAQPLIESYSKTGQYVGAFELIAYLLPKFDQNRVETAQFYVKKVFPLAKTKEGMPTAARVFLKYILPKMSPDWLFWEWGPQPRDNEFEYLKWGDRSGGGYQEIFHQYFLNSSYFGECQRTLRDIIVYLASIDFNSFTGQILDSFSSLMDVDRFLTLLTAIPLINDSKFTEISGIDPCMINHFDEILGKFTNTRFLNGVEKLQNYGINWNQREGFTKQIEESTRIFDKITENWKIDFGNPFEIDIVGAPDPAEELRIETTHHFHLVKILPYFINSESFGSSNWAEIFISLASNRHEVVAQPAYQLCQTILKSPIRSKDLVNQALKMITPFQRHEIVFSCLKLLVDSLETMEPEKVEEEKDLRYSIEYAAFISLASEHPMIRIVAFRLLKRVNKLLINQGFIAYFENHFLAIEANVKDNFLNQEFSKHPGHSTFHEDEIKLRTALSSKYLIPWLYFLSEFCRVLLSANYMPILKRIGLLAQDFCSRSCRNTKELDMGVLVIFVATASIDDEVDNSLNVYSSTRFSEEKVDDYHECVISIIKDYPRDKIKTLYKALCHANYTIIPSIFEISPIFIFNPDYDVLKCTYSLIKCLEENNLINGKIYNCLKLLLDKANDSLCSFIIENFNVLPDKKIEVKINFESDRFKKFEDIILNYFGILDAFLSADDEKIEEEKSSKKFIENNEKSKLIHLIVLLLQRTHSKSLAEKFMKIKRYAANVLVSIFSSGSIFHTNSIVLSKEWWKIADLLEPLSCCEKLGYHIMRPLLINNNIFIEIFIDNCFRTKSVMADVYFDALYGALLDPTIDKQFIIPYTGVLFLLSLYRLKTGSLLARPFLQAFIPFFASQIHSKDIGQQLTDEMKKDIGNCPFKYFGVRLAEPIVRAALNQMMSDKFCGSVKAIVDILEPWIRTFKLLPKQDNCVPSLTTTEKRLTKKQFLDDLMKVTSLQLEHDFSKIVEIWAILLEVKEHKNIIISYIFEYKEPKLKVPLLNSLVKIYPNVLIKKLSQRCRLSFYAYIVYQNKQDIEQEFWAVPVLSKAVKVFKEETYRYLPAFIHFSLLFHASQTMKLLKHLCKVLGISYSRKTLSSSSIQRIVKNFQNSFKKTDNEPDEFTPSPEDLSNEWAKEAMRWVVGCRNLKLAHSSLIILNQLGYSFTNDNETINELLKGVMRSAAFFLQQSCGQTDHNSLYEYINDTFQLFTRHFVGHEIDCFEYISSYLNFIVPVDAYFSKMLRLYECCFTSPITSERARSSIIPFLRPFFNELEADSKAKDSFDSFAKQIGKDEQDRIDIDFVRSALLRGSARNVENDRKMVFDANLNDLNRVIGHYSIMIETASTDLKKRIFVILTLILQKFEKIKEEREEKEQEGREQEDDIQQILKSREIPISNKASMEQPIDDNQRPIFESEDFANTEKFELNKQSIVPIFNAATNMLPGCQEALDFVVRISHIDPLISTIPIFDDRNWSESANSVIDILIPLGKQDNDTVTLTDCEKISSASNLLDETSQPKILPFTTQHEQIENINREQQRPSGYKIENWMRTLSSIGMELHKKMADRITPKSNTAGELSFEPIPIPQKFIPNEKITRTEAIPEILLTTTEFLQLPSDKGA